MKSNIQLQSLGGSHNTNFKHEKVFLKWYRDALFYDRAQSKKIFIHIDLLTIHFIIQSYHVYIDPYVQFETVTLEIIRLLFP